jgi:hypothetical protein
MVAAILSKVVEGAGSPRQCPLPRFPSPIAFRSAGFAFQNRWKFFAQNASFAADVCEKFDLNRGRHFIQLSLTFFGLAHHCHRFASQIASKFFRPDASLSVNLYVKSSLSQTRNLSELVLTPLRIVYCSLQFVSRNLLKFLGQGVFVYACPLVR